MATKKSKIFGTQKAKVPHLAGKSQSGMKGEIGDLRADVEASFLAFEAQGSRDRVEEFLALRAASPNAIKASFASSNQARTLGKADLDGALGTTELVPPRNITITASSHADATSVAIVITGKVRDANGILVPQTETINTTGGGGQTNAGVKAFSIIDTSIAIPAQGGAGAQLQIGIGNVVGLASKPRTAAGLLLVSQQVTNGAVVTNGVFDASIAPNGTWSPATPPNGTNNYAIRYNVDPG